MFTRPAHSLVDEIIKLDFAHVDNRGLGFLDPVRGKPRPSGRGRIARTPQASFGRLMWRLLLFDVLPDDFDGCAAAASSEAGGRPQRAAP
jgi:hypothetical protein